ncbi:MAG: 30S ribosomal protein S6 [bacterium]|nr:30S ribosomal protein S6 [bacterium]
MTMRRYEALFLSVPEITQDETKTIETELTRLVQGAKGNIVSFERWGKYKLAYPVKKNDYGVYFLVRFEVPADSAIMNEIRILFDVKFHEIIMRSAISHLELHKTLEYQRPKSLEEAPASHDVGAFLKENKMEGLFSSVESPDEDTEEDDRTELAASDEKSNSKGL